MIKLRQSNFKLEKTTFDPNQSGNTFMAANFTVTDKSEIRGLFYSEVTR